MSYFSIMHTKNSRWLVQAVLAGIVLMGAGFVVLTLVAEPRIVQSATSSTSVTGYLWSDTIGWIDLNCSNSNTCASRPFGMTMASDGTLSGYAWSDNIGWVSANASDVAGCPSGTCVPVISSGGTSGWLRALSGGTSQNGGWDGFIDLVGSGYGVTKGSGGTFSGYAWGDTNVGWVDFSRMRVTASCVAQYMCSGKDRIYQDSYCSTNVVKTCSLSCTLAGCSEDLTPPTATLQIQPTLVRVNGITHITWSSTDAVSCTLIGGSDSTTGVASPPGGYVSQPITDTTDYTLTCTGDGGTVTATKTVKVAPIWTEI